eukprot:scaffold7994_cov57-Phaeocystis_antarctica.AAC.1
MPAPASSFATTFSPASASSSGVAVATGTADTAAVSSSSTTAAVATAAAAVVAASVVIVAASAASVTTSVAAATAGTHTRSKVRIGREVSSEAGLNQPSSRSKPRGGTPRNVVSRAHDATMTRPTRLAGTHRTSTALPPPALPLPSLPPPPAKASRIPRATRDVLHGEQRLLRLARATAQRRHPLVARRRVGRAQAHGPRSVGRGDRQLVHLRGRALDCDDLARSERARELDATSRRLWLIRRVVVERAALELETPRGPLVGQRFAMASPLAQRRHQRGVQQAAVGRLHPHLEQPHSLRADHEQRRRRRLRCRRLPRLRYRRLLCHVLRRRYGLGRPGRARFAATLGLRRARIQRRLLPSSPPPQLAVPPPRAIASVPRAASRSGGAPPLAGRGAAATARLGSSPAAPPQGRRPRPYAGCRRLRRCRPRKDSAAPSRAAPGRSTRSYTSHARPEPQQTRASHCRQRARSCSRSAPPPRPPLPGARDRRPRRPRRPPPRERALPRCVSQLPRTTAAAPGLGLGSESESGPRLGLGSGYKAVAPRSPLGSRPVAGAAAATHGQADLSRPPPPPPRRQPGCMPATPPRDPTPPPGQG